LSRRLSFSLLTVLLSSGCPGIAPIPPDAASEDASFADLPDAAGDAGPPSHCPDTPTRIMGTALVPNGMDPVPGIFVYATLDSHVFAPPAATVECQTCRDSPPDAIAYTRTSADGTFSLRGAMLDDGGTFTIVTESGGFRHVERHVEVPACGELVLPSSATTLPGRASGDDVVPRIAVARATMANVNDDFGRVLEAIGVGFDVFDPNRTGARLPNDMIGLIGDPAALAGYQILALPCGSLGNFSVGPVLTPALVENLRAWLAQGGRLYVSDLAYEVVAQTFPDAIVFAEGPSSRAGADDADVGQGIDAATTLDAIVEDEALLAWLQVVGAVPDGSAGIGISDLRDPWAAIDRLPPESLAPDATGHTHASILVSGDVTWHTMATAFHPLTVQADYPDGAGSYCGRVLFSSYHVQTSRDDTLAPQERVLEYLFFQLGGCIQSGAP
jgi:hypothetical protein